VLLAALRGLRSYASQRMDLVFFFREDDGDMGRNQRLVEISLEFKVGGLESTIRDWPTSKARRMHSRLRGREINGRLFRVLKTVSCRVRATTMTPSRLIPATLADHIEERREGHRINKTSKEGN